MLICRPSWYSTIRDWESRYQTSIFSSGISHVDALRAHRGEPLAKGRKRGAFRMVEDLSLIADTIPNNVFLQKPRQDHGGVRRGHQC